MKTSEPGIIIASCGIGRESISHEIESIVASADILAGGNRLLALFPEFKGETVPIVKNVSQTVHELIDASQTRTVVVLTSGDSLFHGIARQFCEHMPLANFRIIPNITAFQSAYAKLGQPWDDVMFFSLHGKTQTVPWRQILNTRHAAIYADPSLTAADIARTLVEKFPRAASRPAAIVACLGSDDELVIRGTLGEVARNECPGLSMLLVFGGQDSAAYPGLTLGLPDDSFAHQNGLITHSEVRAVVISKLRVGPGVIWDLGAGSGSVGIEIASLCRDVTVHCVEKQPERLLQINENKEQFGAANLTAHEGNSLDLIASLPKPVAVFVGGGGDDVSEILQAAYSRLVPGGRIVATAVTLETKAALSGTLSKHCTEVVSLNVSRSRTIADKRMLKAENPIDIYIYEKPLANSN